MVDTQLKLTAVYDYYSLSDYQIWVHQKHVIKLTC